MATPQETAFREALNKLRITQEVSEGCGDRAQGFIDSAFADVKAAYKLLPDGETKTNHAKMIAKGSPSCSDDRTGGFASGYGSYLRETSGYKDREHDAQRRRYG
jgi:hypothetical protein